MFWDKFNSIKKTSYIWFQFINFQPMNKILSFAVLATLLSCGSNKHPMFENLTTAQIEQDQSYGENIISNALKEALSKGVHKEVTVISNHNGFFKNNEIKLGLPENLEKVDQALRNLGMGHLSDKGVELLNHVAEDATNDSKTVVLEVIKKMIVTDATGILKGSENAATAYFEKMHKEELKTLIIPIVAKSYEKIAAKHWNAIIDQYNGLKFVKEKIALDLNPYLSEKVASAIIVAITKSEKEIRTNEEARDTETLRRIFALQDKK